MGLQWTVVASFLYCEMLLILILYSSLISPSRWQKIFKSHLLNCTISYLNPCFLVFIIFIVILFADAIHEIRKYSDYDTHAIANMVSTTSDKMHMKLFRAQRNFYISGFSLLFWLIIRRLVMLISQQARLHLDSEVLEEQLQSADAAIKKCMKENKVQQENHCGNFWFASLPSLETAFIRQGCFSSRCCRINSKQERTRDRHCQSY
uniref:Endoplasmic reticulum transmembrane protein n=1 Tax=Eptatretus burgeri TaxID=7764 RepID=A0A8C4RBK8_EPTBU